VVNIAVHEQPEISISVDNDLVCVGGTSQFTSVITNGSGFYTYQWQSSADQSNWSSISPNGTNASYTSVATSAGTTYYRLLLTDLSNGCNDPISNTLSITVQDQPTVEITVDNNLVLYWRIFYYHFFDHQWIRCCHLSMAIQS
jgi:hypothetical protein